VQYDWQIISKNGNCFSTAGPIQTFTLRDLPDLTIQNVQSPSTASERQQISATWEVHNRGTGSTGSQQWSDAVYLSTDTILQTDGTDIYLAGISNFAALQAAGSYSNTATFNLPPGAVGNYFILVQTDAFLQLLEV